MNDRRQFLKTAALTTAAVTLASAGVSMASGTAMTNIIYTADNPGKWKGKEGSHAPQVTVANGKVSLMTKHPMSEMHYIVRHTVVLADGTVVGAKTFTSTDTPASSYELPAGYTGKVYCTSFCNLHDFWMTEATA